MIGVFGHQHLADCLALRAGPLATDVALHREHTGHTVQLLDHVFTDAPSHSHRRRWAGNGWRCSISMATGRQVSLDLVFEQVVLLGVEAFGLGCPGCEASITYFSTR